MEWYEVGRSVRGQVIRGARMGDGPETTLFLGLHHGNEQAGQPLLERLMDLLVEEPGRLAGRAAVFVPVLNPDGRDDNTRQNARGVDLNRNLPTHDWGAGPAEGRYNPGAAPASEPETQALVRLVESFQPVKIISVHAPLLCVNWNGASRSSVAALVSPAPDRYVLDGRVIVCAEALGEAMASLNGYPLEAEIGYPCPGSFGTWAGRERNIATMTLELGRNVGIIQSWNENRDALLAALEF